VKELFFIRPCFAILVVLATRTTIQGQPTNLPPKVSIVWPVNDGCFYNRLVPTGAFFKIKAEATDEDGSIAQVQFFYDSNLIGIVSNAPYSMICTSTHSWGSTHQLKAVAIDNLGTSAESPVVDVGFGQDGFTPLSLDTLLPPHGSVLAAPAAFQFNAELLTSTSSKDSGPMDFFVGTNYVGTVTQSGPYTLETSLYSLTVTNIPEGTYDLHLRLFQYLGPLCRSTTIRVTKLGMQFARTTPEGGFQFEVITSFPTNQNVVETSSNLLNWTPISTNVPMTNTFTFTEPSPATNSPRFYRAVVPSQ